jgi:hypothetical protein
VPRCGSNRSIYSVNWQAGRQAGGDDHPGVCMYVWYALTTGSSTLPLPEPIDLPMAEKPFYLSLFEMKAWLVGRIHLSSQINQQNEKWGIRKRERGRRTIRRSLLSLR